MGKLWRNQGCTMGKRVLQLPIEEIRLNPDQPRREMSYAALLELAQSISENGLLNPVSVCFEDGCPLLIAGERRLRAARLAGMREIPCIEVAVPPQQRALLALVENIQRESMSCFDMADGLYRLIQTYQLTQEEAAAKLGCSQSTVANRLRLRRLSQEVRQIVQEHELSERHARALLRLPDDMQATAARHIAEKGLTVAAAERLIGQLLEEKPAPRKKLVPAVRDIRVFINTVNHALEAIQKSGIRASAERSETPESIEYIIRIPKQPSA